MTRKKGVMSFKLFKKIIDDIKDFKPAVVLHHSGESLLNQKLYDFIRYAKQQGLTVSMTTNGTLLRRDNFEILNMGIDSVSISLAGVDEEDYRKVRPESNFQALINDIASFAAEKVKRKSNTIIRINVILTKDNKNKITQFKKFIKSISGIDDIVIRRLMDWSGQVDIKNKRLRNLSHLLFIRIRYCYKRLKIYQKGGLCSAINHGGAILWDGTVVPCCIDFNGVLALGNVKEDSFLNIWNGEKANRLRAMLKSVKLTKDNPTCNTCLFPKS